MSEACSGEDRPIGCKRPERGILIRGSDLRKNGMLEETFGGRGS